MANEQPHTTKARSGLLRIDASGRVQWATRGACSLLGLAPGTLVGRTWQETFPDVDRAGEIPAALLRECLAQGDASHEGVREPGGERLRSFLECDGEGFVEHLAPTPALDLFDEALVALDHAERLQQVATALSGAVSVSDAVDVFVQHALPALGGRSGAVALPSRDRTHLELVEGRLSPLRVPEQYRRIRLDADLALVRSWKSGQTAWITDRRTYEALFGQVPDALDALGLTSIAFVPMHIGTEPVGMLVFEIVGSDHLRDARRRFAEAVAQSCAHAFARARLAEEERRMQAAIAASERRLREITSAVPLLVWMADATGQLTWVNDERARAYFGVGLEMLGTEGPLVRVHPDDHPRTVRIARRARERGVRYEVEHRLLRHDGEWRWHLVRVEPSRNERGEVVCWYGSSTDIHDQKVTSEALAASEQRLRLALQMGRMVAWQYHLATDVLETADNAEEAGLPPSGARAIDVVRGDIHPDDQAETERLFRTAIAQQRDFEGTFRRMFADGQWHWMAARATCVRDVNGRVVGMRGISRDVNEEKRAELRLRASEELFRTVAEALPVMVWMTDAAGRADFFNARFWDYTGLTPGSLDAQRSDTVMQGLTHPDDLPSLLASWKESVESGTPLEHEYRIRSHEQTWRWHLSRTVPVRDEAGDIVRWVGSATDIDDQKRILSEREELLARTQEAVRGREVFLAVAAHELRTPLTPLRLHVDTLLRAARAGGELPATRVQRGLEVASRQMHRLQLLVEALLDVSRIASGRLELQPEQLELAHVARDVVERTTHEGRPGQVTVVAPDALPVHLDRLRFEQVLTNLVTNALKYGRGSPVQVELDATDDLVRVQVRDQGIGIAPEDRERIFERFERAGDNLPQGGLGLGLWIVRQLVGAMGGTIAVESELGRGSTFRVELPRQG